MDRKGYGLYRDLLLELRARYEDTVESIERSGLDRPAQEAIGELSMYDNHPADIASETFERSKDLGLRMNAQWVMRRVDAALLAMDQGTYGVCKDCGRDIDPKRLFAVPYATRCVQCQKAEEERVYRGRPLEEGIIPMPFGHRAEQVQYDGGDAWADAAMGGFAGEIDDPSHDRKG